MDKYYKVSAAICIMALGASGMAAAILGDPLFFIRGFIGTGSLFAFLGGCIYFYETIRKHTEGKKP